MRIAVDDAGTGYAGLLHVLRLQPDFVKLDIALIRNIDQDRARRALVTALIAFTAETGAVLIAEGIETPSELATLHQLGIPYGQGYLLSRPCPFPCLPDPATPPTDGGHRAPATRADWHQETAKWVTPTPPRPRPSRAARPHRSCDPRGLDDAQQLAEVAPPDAARPRRRRPKMNVTLLHFDGCPSWQTTMWVPETLSCLFAAQLHCHHHPRGPGGRQQSRPTPNPQDRPHRLAELEGPSGVRQAPGGGRRR